MTQRAQKCILQGTKHYKHHRNSMRRRPERAQRVKFQARGRKQARIFLAVWPSTFVGWATTSWPLRLLLLLLLLLVGRCLSIVKPTLAAFDLPKYVYCFSSCLCSCCGCLCSCLLLFVLLLLLFVLLLFLAAPVSCCCCCFCCCFWAANR